MIFWKIDEETIRCLINKDEIASMGYDLNAISEDAEQMESFLETIVANSREYIEWHTENGIQNYHARILPADQYLITISCTFQDEIIDRNVDQIRKMTDALNSRVSEERLKKIEALTGEEKEKAFAELSRDLFAVYSGEAVDDRKKEIVTEKTGEKESPSTETGNKSVARDENLPDRKLVFSSLDDVIAFAGMLSPDTLYTSSLFKSEEEYVLLVQFDRCKKDSDALAFILTAEEYGGRCSPVAYDQAYMLEHGKLMLAGNALTVLASL